MTRLHTFYAFFTKNTYRKEISAAISVKLLALILIWGLFFSTPLTKQFKQHKDQLADHFVKDNMAKSSTHDKI